MFPLSSRMQKRKEGEEQQKMFIQEQSQGAAVRFIRKRIIQILVMPSLLHLVLGHSDSSLNREHTFHGTIFPVPNLGKFARMNAPHLRVPLPLKKNTDSPHHLHLRTFCSTCP